MRAWELHRNLLEEAYYIKPKGTTGRPRKNKPNSKLFSRNGKGRLTIYGLRVRSIAVIQALAKLQVGEWYYIYQRIR